MVPPIYGQKPVIGVVADSLTGERLGYVNIYAPSIKKGVLSDDKGVFTIRIPAKGTLMKVTCLGYTPRALFVKPGLTDTLRVMMMEKAADLDEVVVNPGKQKYSKKNNPAVELMQSVRKSAAEHDPTRQPYYSFDKYQKITMAMNDVDASSISKRFKGKLGFLQDYIDTALWTGQPVLNLTVKEKASKQLHRSDPASTKEIILGNRSEGIDKAFNTDNFQLLLEDVMREIDIFGNDITLMQNRFVSPLSAIGPDYYKYYINDTVWVDGDRCVELAFVPRTPESFGFNGRMFVVLGDTTHFVKRVSMRVPSHINLNYVDNIYVSQNFQRDSLGNRHKTLDDLSLELKILPGTPGFYATRQLRQNNFSYDKPDEFGEFLDKLGRDIAIDQSDDRDNEFWQESRMIPLTRAEAMMGSMMSRARKIPFIYWAEKVLVTVANGYIYTGKKSKFDFGPVNTLISFNSVEGVRLRAGGMTTANLSKHLFGRGYVAYGFKDHRWKYGIEAEYSFPEKKYHSHEFPMNGIRFTYKYDLDRIGQHYLYTNADNVFLSLKRMESNLTTYQRLAQLEYNLELANHFSVNATVKRETQYATPWVQFRLPDNRLSDNYTTSTFKLTLRYAPGEKFVQKISTRPPVNMDAPVFMLSHEFGPKNFGGSSFSINRTEASVQKRVWFSAFGYADVLLKAGKIWSKVQFPALYWQNANLSYTIQPESFALLNPMEFAMDQYASWDVTYWINGAILNRIPLVKKLKWREVVSFKGFAGSLSRKNNPEYNDDLFRFPADSHTRPMGGRPYMELSAGLDNVLTILRLDYVWRLSYRDMPHIDKSGVRVSLHFTF